MATAYTSLLGFALPVTGELSGTWGDVVNNSITQLVEDSVAGYATASVTSGNWTLTTSGSGAANQARMAILIATGTPGTARSILAPNSSKAYIVENQSDSTVTIKGVTGPTTGVAISAGSKVLVAWTGSDFVQVGASGTVTSVAVASSNGFAGTSSGGATPSLTLTTTVTGVVKGNGTALSAATAGTDYLAPPSGTSILKANSGGALANATAGTDYLAPPSGTAILKANSGGALANATAGTDYVAPGTATDFTALQTFTGSTSVLASKFINAKEAVSVSATAATGTINYDVTTQSVIYYTTSASANWTVNFRASSGTSLDSAMSTGESVTVAFLVTQGATAYYNSVVQVDGGAVTPKYQGGTAWTGGNASSIDAYVYTIVKTGSATFTVFASQTKFA